MFYSCINIVLDFICTSEKSKTNYFNIIFTIIINAYFATMIR